MSCARVFGVCIYESILTALIDRIYKAGVVYGSNVEMYSQARLWHAMRAIFRRPAVKIND